MSWVGRREVRILGGVPNTYLTKCMSSAQGETDNLIFIYVRMSLYTTMLETQHGYIKES